MSEKERPDNRNLNKGGRLPDHHHNSSRSYCPRRVYNLLHSPFRVTGDQTNFQVIRATWRGWGSGLNKIWVFFLRRNLKKEELKKDTEEMANESPITHGFTGKLVL